MIQAFPLYKARWIRQRVVRKAGSLALATLLLGVPIMRVEAQQLHERAPVGQLELVAPLPGDQPAGIAVAPSGRIFVTFPRHDGDVAFTVGEISAGNIRAFPDQAMNRAEPERPEKTLFSVQNARLDEENRLWLLDSGFLKVGQPPLPGAPKLVAIDLGTNRITQTIVFPADALAPNSALKDLRIDLGRGKAGTIFIADNAAGKEALIVVDLAERRVRRRLEGHASMRPPPTTVMLVGAKPLMITAADGQRQPFASGLNRLAISNDGAELYYSAFTSRQLYSVDAKLLTDAEANDDDIARTVRDVGEVGISSHLETDRDGRIYVSALEHDAIIQRLPDGTLQTIVASPRLMWPDTTAVAADGFIYVTSSQHDQRPQFHDGRDLRQRPFALYRAAIGSGPVVLPRR
jgi:sugar lactone lactonase YvrE